MQELRGEVWAYASSVMCFVGGQLLGDEKELLKWSYHQWDYRDFKPEALYQAIAEDFYTKYLKNSQASSAVLGEEYEAEPELGDGEAAGEHPLLKMRTAEPPGPSAARKGKHSPGCLTCINCFGAERSNKSALLTVPQLCCSEVPNLGYVRVPKALGYPYSWIPKAQLLKLSFPSEDLHGVMRCDAAPH